jgi:tetratricopeptide (TPR) repeat protein
MAEDDSASEGAGAPGPSAMTWALGANSEDARVLLRKQARLVDLQIADLEREDKVRHWSLRVRHVSDVLKLAFELAAAAVVTAIALFIAGAVWTAVHDNGLVIEAFDVPADFAQRGLTGKMLAGQLVDRLAQMQEATNSARPAASYRNNWGNDIKVQIPDAGISIGEFESYLHEWLGHQTRISGELYRTPKGIAVVAHIGDRSATLEGQESDLGTLLQKTAEAVYGQTQPYRYATYLDRHGRAAENVEILKRLSSDPSPLERAWAFIGLANNKNDIGDAHGAVAYYAMAQAQVPDFPMPVWDAQFDDEIFGHDEAVVAKGRKLLEALKSSTPYISERARTMMVQIISQTQSGEFADFNDVVAHAKIAEGLPDYQNGIEDGRQAEIAAYGYLHDPSSMLRRLNQLPPANNIDQAARLANLATGEFMSERWHDAARDAGTAQTMADRLGPGAAIFEATAIWPYLAMADAALGARQQADALAAKMPLDCMWCTIARGRVDELEGKSDSAARWFANAQKQAPSIPFPDLYWGAMLLHRRDLDGAIAKFDSAHKKGPHFADPLEMWGEALIAKNRSDLALAKFEEAAKYAPNWGRLHLKWGEALVWSGHKDDAAKQFALARTLDLTGAERAELSRMSS